MTLQEAIERGRQAVGNNSNLYVLTNKEALLMLIEAGRSIIAHRKDFRNGDIYELPGETEE